MKAIIATNYGNSEALTYTENAKKPTLQENHVLVKIHAASINPFDIALLSGVYKAHMPLTFPATPGGDFAGTVIEVGKNVTNLAIGDEVYGTANVLSGGTGSFAEFATASSGSIAKKPHNISFIEAAALPLVGTSAVQALEEHMQLAAGQKILIHGGAGGIGHIAIQLAKTIGAHIITTVSTNDMPFVTQLGADEIIDYTKQQFETLVNQVDAVFDTVGGETTATSFKVLKKGGILVSMKGQPDETLATQYGITSIGQGTKNNTPHLARLTELVEAGSIHVHVAETFPLIDIKKAWELQQTRPQGKLVVTISDTLS
jgi:NADPH:quinone reductase-like Zn-dependent oxidoreductase